MIGFALRLGTNAAAATMLQLAGIGTRQARVIRNLISLPLDAVDAAVEATFGLRVKPRAIRRPGKASGTPAVPGAPPVPGSGISASCPDAEALAAYADHALLPEEQSRVENHLVECEACRSRIVWAVGPPAPEDACTAYRA